jgi:hypothetical protein
MKQTDDDSESGFEADIARRMDALIANKRAENELVIARIATLDTAWKTVNSDIDKDLKRGLDTADMELQVVRDMRDRLTRNVCEGIDRNAVGLAGKVVDAKSKIGLPGLTVKIELPEAALQSAKTDNYGDFFFSVSVEALKSKRISAVVQVLTDADTVVCRKQESIEPKTGAVKRLILEVDCSRKLEDVLEYGKQVVASVKSDEKLVEARAANFKDAYAVFKGLSTTTLSELRSLKQELSVTPPQPVFMSTSGGSAATGVEKTRFLGNSHLRELHDLENTKRRCNIEKIRPDHRVYFKTEEEAEAAGYDYCAYCFGKEKSKR